MIQGPDSPALRSEADDPELADVEEADLSAPEEPHEDPSGAEPVAAEPVSAEFVAAEPMADDDLGQQEDLIQHLARAGVVDTLITLCDGPSRPDEETALTRLSAHVDGSIFRVAPWRYACRPADPDQIAMTLDAICGDAYDLAQISPRGRRPRPRSRIRPMS